MKYPHRSLGNASGFTILELMVATLVFSVILVAITVGVISFSHSYYQGVNASTTQNTTRDAVDTVTQAIQFSSGPINHAGTTTYCIGNVQFDVSLGTVVDGSSVHGIYETPISPGASGCTAQTFGPNSQELLGLHMRVTSFSISPNSGSIGLYTVRMHVVYGATELLASPSGGPVGTSSDTNCKGQVGSQFCAVADITATVEKRVQ